MPSVPITSAIPRETIRTGETWISRLNSVAMVTKLVVKITLKSTSPAKATYTPLSRAQPTILSMAGVAAAALLTRGLPIPGGLALRQHLHQGLLADLLAGERPDDGPVPENDHPVRAFDHLLQFGGDHDHAQASFRQFVDEVLHFGLGAHVYAAGRLVEDQDLRVQAEPARSEEHTSELQSRQYLVCRLLLEKK